MKAVRKVGRIDGSVLRHGAYNLTTKEVMFFSSPRAMREGVKKRSEINHADGLKNKWVFTHNGVDGIVEKINKEKRK